MKVNSAIVWLSTSHTIAGYGNAVVDWSRSDLVYGGSVNYTHAVRLLSFS